MKKSLSLLLPLLVLMAVSCKKKHFDHDVAYTTPACELCEYADSLEGTFTGWYTGVATMLPNGQPCSLDVTMEHVFLNFGSPLDSTVMYFRKTEHFYSSPEIFHTDTIAIIGKTGRTLDDVPGVVEFNPHHYTIFHDQYTHYGYVIYNQYYGVK